MSRASARIKSSSRIYVVTDTSEDPPTHRLVRAYNRPEAICHVAGSIYACAVASQDSLVDLVAQGHQIEVAGEVGE